MNVREVLDGYAEFAPMTVRDLRGVVQKQVIQVDVLRLASDIEKGFRAAWAEGTADGRSIDCGYGKSSDNGVTAGITVMVES